MYVIRSILLFTIPLLPPGLRCRLNLKEPAPLLCRSRGNSDTDSDKLLVVVFNTLRDKTPAYLASLISPHEPRRTIRSNDRGLLTVPRHNLERYGRRSFSCAVIRCMKTFKFRLMYIIIVYIDIILNSLLVPIVQLCTTMQTLYVCINLYILLVLLFYILVRITRGSPAYFVYDTCL